MMKLRIGDRCTKTLDDGRQLTLEIKDIVLLTDVRPVVGVTIDRHLDDEVDTITTVFAQLVEWTSDEGWTVV
jgi:hypothetical protein